MPLQMATSQVWPRSIYSWWCGRILLSQITRSKPMSFSEGLDCHLNVILLSSQWFLHPYIFRYVVVKFKIDEL